MLISRLCGNDNFAMHSIKNCCNIPISTLNSFLYKHSYEIKPIKLDSPRIRSFESKVSRMNGYHLRDIVKIVFGMDTEVTARIKQDIQCVSK